MKKRASDKYQALFSFEFDYLPASVSGESASDSALWSEWSVASSGDSRLLPSSPATCPPSSPPPPPPKKIDFSAPRPIIDGNCGKSLIVFMMLSSLKAIKTKVVSELDQLSHL